MALNEVEGQDRIRRVLFLLATYAVTLVTLMFFIGTSAARADGTISWEGQGAENTPCPGGAHWVLAPAFGIESATLVVDDLGSFTMTQNGNGSWSADSPGEIDANTGVGVNYTGPGDDRDHLQLSHCLDVSPSPSPSPSPSGSPSPSPSPSGGTKPPTCTGTPPPSVVHTVTRVVKVYVPIASPVQHVQRHVVHTTG